MDARVAAVADRLAELGAAGRVREMPAGTRTAADAAAALGTDVGAIVKSLVFVTASGAPVLVLASGSDRVDIARLSEVTGEPTAQADAKLVKEVTGVSIGGVPPVGHARALRTLVDGGLRRHAGLWAAAGSAFAVFPTTFEELLRITGGTEVDVAVR